MSELKVRKIMLVAGEESGDILGAGLIRALRTQFPDCQFEGIGGSRMIAEGFVSLFPLDRLSVMGFVDPLLRLPELLSILRSLKKNMRDNRPDMFIGIDSPDFNIRLESAAKDLGIFSVHYVSPSVWAWRQGRIKKIKQSVDLMLTVFPFEADFYRKHKVDVEFVGHPLADQLPMEPDQQKAKQDLGLETDQSYLALLPGSRRAEIKYLLPLMWQFVEAHAKSDMAFLLPAANAARKQEILDSLPQSLASKVKIFDGHSHEVMCAADCVLMASGTTTLEAMLLKRPMIITYKMSRISWFIFSRLVKLTHVGLPNLLAKKSLVPELLQDDATAEKLVDAYDSVYSNSEARQEMREEFVRLHGELKKDASKNAARSVVERWRKFNEA